METKQDILAEYAESLVKGEADVEALLKKYDIQPGSDLEALLYLAQSLEGVLVQVAPSAEFINRLRQELLNEDVDTLWYRLRQLTNVQLAAGLGGITFAAGMLWWFRRLGIEIRIRRDEDFTADIAS